VFLLSPKSCTNPWSDSREFDLVELTRGSCSSRELRSHRSDWCRLLLSFTRVNVWVSSLLSCVVAVSSLGQFGAR
jgi:hypothetical protein